MKIAEALVDNTKQLTNKTRLWMEAHPNSPEPRDYSEYPGKMDHCTVMIMKVRNLEPVSTTRGDPKASMGFFFGGRGREEGEGRKGKGGRKRGGREEGRKEGRKGRRKGERGRERGWREGRDRGGEEGWSLREKGRRGTC
jgi:hypothetical protein